jgi:hypothetical protein
MVVKFTLRTIVFALALVLIGLLGYPASAGPVDGIVPWKISASPNPASPGNTVTVTVTLTAAPTSNQVVNLSVDSFGNSLVGLVSIENFPSSMTIGSGQTSGTFTFHIASDSGSGSIEITATCNGGSASCTETVHT